MVSDLRRGAIPIAPGLSADVTSPRLSAGPIPGYGDRKNKAHTQFSQPPPNMMYASGSRQPPMYPGEDEEYRLPSSPYGGHPSRRKTIPDSTLSLAFKATDSVPVAPGIDPSVLAAANGAYMMPHTSEYTHGGSSGTAGQVHRQQQYTNMNMGAGYGDR